MAGAVVEVGAASVVVLVVVVVVVVYPFVFPHELLAPALFSIKRPERIDMWTAQVCGYIRILRVGPTGEENIPGYL